MIADTGLAALWLAAALALVHLAIRARSVATAQAVMAAIATGAMIGTPGVLLVMAAVLFVLALIAIGRGNVSQWIAAGGAGLLVIGTMCDRVFPQQTQAIANPGERLEVGPWLVEFTTLNPVAAADFTAIEAGLRATRGRGVSRLMPQSRTMMSPRGELAQPAVATFWDGRLSATLSAAPNDGRQLRLKWQPFLPLVWLGGALMALAGLIMLIGTLVRVWRTRPQPRGRYE